jgi:hypothetical protein
MILQNGVGIQSGGKPRVPLGCAGHVPLSVGRGASIGAGPESYKLLTLRSCGMCRNIRTLFNFEPPVTEEEIRAASLQFVRKISGFNKPSKANEASFLAAVDEIAGISNRLLHSLETNAPARNREEEAAKAKLRAVQRFGT